MVTEFEVGRIYRHENNPVPVYVVGIPEDTSTVVTLSCLLIDPVTRQTHLPNEKRVKKVDFGKWSVVE